MTTAQVVETSVTINNNSPVQDYVHPDDQTQPTFGPEIATLQGQLIFFPASTVSDHRSSNFWETCLPGIAVISWSMSDFFMGLSFSSASSVLDTILWSVANWWTLDKALKMKKETELGMICQFGRSKGATNLSDEIIDEWPSQCPRRLKQQQACF